MVDLPPELKDEAEVELPKLRVEDGPPLEVEAHAPTWLRSGFLFDRESVYGWAVRIK